MPSAAVKAAFDTKLTASWTASAVIGLAGVITPPPDADAFLVVQYPVVNANKPVLNGRYFENGAARLVLNVRSNIMMTDGLGWADTLASLFREYRPGNGFETFVPSAPIINNTNDNGEWSELAVIVPYRYQFAG